MLDSIHNSIHTDQLAICCATVDSSHYQLYPTEPVEMAAIGKLSEVESRGMEVTFSCPQIKLLPDGGQLHSEQFSTGQNCWRIIIEKADDMKNPDDEATTRYGLFLTNWADDNYILTPADMDVTFIAAQIGSDGDGPTRGKERSYEAGDEVKMGWPSFGQIEDGEETLVIRCSLLTSLKVI